MAAFDAVNQPEICLRIAPKKRQSPCWPSRGFALSSARISRSQWCVRRPDPRFLAQTLSAAAAGRSAGRFAAAGVAARPAATGLTAATLLAALHPVAAGLAATSLLAAAAGSGGAGRSGSASRFAAAGLVAARPAAAIAVPAVPTATGLAAASRFATASHVLAAGNFAAAGHVFPAGDFAAASGFAATAISAAEAEEFKRAGLAGQTQQSNSRDHSNNTIPHGRGSSKPETKGGRKRKQRNDLSPEPLAPRCTRQIAAGLDWDRERPLSMLDAESSECYRPVGRSTFTNRQALAGFSKLPGRWRKG